MNIRMKASSTSELVRVSSSHPDLVRLVKSLDAELAIRDGDEHDFYNQFNGLDSIPHAVVLYDQGSPAACGAIKPFDANSMEVKRMYTLPEYRGKGLAQEVLKNLELWAASLGCKICVLETGRKQPEAIALYTKCGYERIPNYGQYEGKENSLCFKKSIEKDTN